MKNTKVLNLAEAENVSVCWKALHITLLVLSTLFGITSGIILSFLFMDEEFLCGIAILSKPELGTNDTHPELSIIFSGARDKDGCRFTQFTMLCSFIFGCVWTVFFLMCGPGGKSDGGLPQPWRIVFPAFVFSGIYFFVTLGAGIQLSTSKSKFCALFADLLNSLGVQSNYPCDHLNDYLTVTDLPNKYIETMVVASETIVWLCVMAWGGSATLCLLRLLVGPDFKRNYEKLSDQGSLSSVQGSQALSGNLASGLTVDQTQDSGPSTIITEVPSLPSISKIDQRSSNIAVPETTKAIIHSVFLVEPPQSQEPQDNAPTSINKTSTLDLERSVSSDTTAKDSKSEIGDVNTDAEVRKRETGAAGHSKKADNTEGASTANTEIQRINDNAPNIPKPEKILKTHKSTKSRLADITDQGTNNIDIDAKKENILKEKASTVVEEIKNNNQEATNEIISNIAVAETAEIIVHSELSIEPPQLKERKDSEQAQTSSNKSPTFELKMSNNTTDKDNKSKIGGVNTSADVRKRKTGAAGHSKIKSGTVLIDNKEGTANTDIQKINASNIPKLEKLQTKGHNLQQEDTEVPKAEAILKTHKSPSKSGLVDISDQGTKNINVDGTKEKIVKKKTSNVVSNKTTVSTTGEERKINKHLAANVRSPNIAAPDLEINTAG